MRICKFDLEMKLLWRALAIIALVAFSPCELLRAEAPSVTAVLTSSEAAIGQMVQLQIKVTGTRNASPPREINVDGLEIQSTGQTQSFEMHNFDVRSSVVFNYTILPTRAGTFKIPGQIVQVEGKSVRTPELALNVSGSGNAGGNSARANRANPNVDPKQLQFLPLF